MATLLLDINPVGLVRGSSAERFALEAYVNDRPYLASFLSEAIAHVFGTAIAGSSKDRHELVQMSIPFEVIITALPCRWARLYADCGRPNAGYLW